MLYAYLLENRMKAYSIDNQPIFKMIRECSLEEDAVFIDAVGDGVRNDLNRLISNVKNGDTVIFRSLVDVADTADEIVSLLKMFAEKGVDVVSVVEFTFDLKKNASALFDGFRICSELAEKKRRLGIERAKADGRMGRKVNLEVVDRVQRLRASGFSLSEILKMCNISRSTYYRIIKNEKI